MTEPTDGDLIAWLWEMIARGSIPEHRGQQLVSAIRATDPRLHKPSTRASYRAGRKRVLQECAIYSSNPERYRYERGVHGWGRDPRTVLLKSRLDAIAGVVAVDVEQLDAPSLRNLVRSIAPMAKAE